MSGYCIRRVFQTFTAIYSRGS